MTLEVVKVRLVLNLQVQKGSRWRELAPFRESVLAHFANPELRAELAALCEAVADQLLEREEEGPAPGEPWSTVHLRAVIEDLRYSKEGLRALRAALSENGSIPNRKQLSQHIAALIRQLDRGLGDLELDLGPPPG